MKVKAWKNLDIEFEADVTFDDILTEFGEIVDQADGEHIQRLLSTLDWSTRMLARVKDESIAAMTEEQRTILCERFLDQAARYDPAP